MTNFVGRNQGKHINVEKELTQPELSSHPRRGLHRWQTWPGLSISQRLSGGYYSKWLQEDVKWQLEQMQNVQIAV